MTLELIKCPHCGYKYETNVEKFVEDGEAVVVRLEFFDIKKILRKKAKDVSVDLTCPNCKKEFEYEVKA